MIMYIIWLTLDSIMHYLDIAIGNTVVNKTVVKVSLICKLAANIVQSKTTKHVASNNYTSPDKI